MDRAEREEREGYATSGCNTEYCVNNIKCGNLTDY